MNLALWFRFAWRDLRSGLQGFWIFLACLALGTAAIALVGSLAAAVERGLDEQGQPLLGGDIEFSLVQRQASSDEMDFLKTQGGVSETATMRVMAVAGNATTLAEAKAIDGNYPLYGNLALAEGGEFRGELGLKDGVFGAVADPLLMGRLGIKQGDRIRLGSTEIQIRGTIASEPDRISDGIILGPRLLLSKEALQSTGLLQPGSLVTWRYRVKLPGNPDLNAIKSVASEAEKKFPDAGWQIRNRNNAAQGVERFVDRLGYFMTLVGLASLIVGGAGIANAASAFVARKTQAIATLKCLGARARDIFGIYLVELMLVALIAVAMGLAVGALVPWIARETMSGLLPLPLSAHFAVKPLAVAGSLGLLVALTFAVWPLSRARAVPASILFRSRTMSPKGWPDLGALMIIAAALAAMCGIVFLSFDEPRLTSYFLGGLAASFVVLLALALAIKWLAARLPAQRSVTWRYALGNLHRPGSAAVSVILALGLGLTLFVTLALTDRSISRELRSGLPESAPAFFFLDVRNAELDQFSAFLKSETGVTGISSAPMMRGRITSVKGVPANAVKAAPEAGWALRGDRGLTYAETLPKGSMLVEGSWWPKDYNGPPLVSLVGEIAKGLGIGIGDSITVNVLGREITAKVANLREVNWRSLGINFVMVFSPNTLKSAPHSHIVTVEMTGGDEAKLLNAAAQSFPSVTAVRVKDAIGIVSDLLGKMLLAIRGASSLTLFTGVLVLAGALAAGLSQRLYDAVVLKTYGASRRQLIGAFIIEYAGLGLAAAAFGIIAGSAASWFLAKFILEMPWSFSLWTALLTALIGMTATISGGLIATWSALSAKPSAYLRNE